MTDLFDLLALPLLACILLIGIHCQFGLQVLKRSVVFVDLALAQCAALGATVAFMQGHLPQTGAAYAWSLGFAWGGALLLSLVRFAPKQIPHEALVGVVYVASVSAALLLIEKAPQGAEHLKQILTGSVLTVSADELLRAAPMYALIGVLLWIATQRRWLERPGLAGWLADFGFYAAFGLVVTSSVAMAGVLLVFSFLIVPSLMGLLFATSSARQLALGWMGGFIAAAIGLAASYALDTSTGATMVCSFALMLVLALVVRSFVDLKIRWKRALKVLTLGCGSVVMVSAMWLGVQPRADQPLLDAAETLFPAMRAVYLNDKENAMYADAQIYAARYTAEAARLSGIESRSRWQGTSVDDEAVKRISSFQQSYNEMIKGEQFVMKETRSRARQRLRLPVALGAAALLLGLLGWMAGFQRIRKMTRLGRRPRRETTTMASKACV